MSVSASEECLPHRGEPEKFREKDNRYRKHGVLGDETGRSGWLGGEPPVGARGLADQTEAIRAGGKVYSRTCPLFRFVQFSFLFFSLVLNRVIPTFSCFPDMNLVLDWYFYHMQDRVAAFPGWQLRASKTGEPIRVRCFVLLIVMVVAAAAAVVVIVAVVETPALVATNAHLQVPGDTHFDPPKGGMPVFNHIDVCPSPPPPPPWRGCHR